MTFAMPHFDARDGLTGIPGGDPYWSNVLFLSGFEGADTSTTIVNEGPDAAIITAGGNAQIDTAQFKMGASSLLCDGTGDYIAATPYVGDYLLSTVDWTMEGWFRWNVDTGFPMLMGKWRTTGNDKSYSIFYTNSSSELRLYLSTDGAASIVQIAYSWTPTLNTQYHIAADFDGTTYRLYLGGVEVGTSTTLRTLHANVTPFTVGAQYAGSNPFDGWVDEVRLTRGTARYAGAFTPHTAAHPRGAGAPTDPYWANVLFLSGFDGADGSTTIVNEGPDSATTAAVGSAQLDTAQFKMGLSSLLCDGTGDAITSVPDAGDYLLSTVDWTMESWFRWNTDPAGFRCLMGVWRSTGNQRSYSIFYQSTGDELRLYLSEDGSTSITQIAYSWTPTLNTWYHIAADFDGTTYRLYLGGVEVGTSTSLRTLYASAAKFSVGGQDNGSDSFDGRSEESRLTGEVARYGGAFTPHTLAHPRS